MLMLNQRNANSVTKSERTSMSRLLSDSICDTLQRLSKGIQTTERFTTLELFPYGVMVSTPGGSLRGAGSNPAEVVPRVASGDKRSWRGIGNSLIRET